MTSVHASAVAMTPEVHVAAQAFVDWRMDLLTERPATQLMEECMTGIMKVGLLSALLSVQACPGT